MKKTFTLQSEYEPAGDQGTAIKSLMGGLKKGLKEQTLFGATGTGKTFTMANIIEKTGKATLIIAHNKTLAAQLAQEFKSFFPTHAVHYFVSYYDYYQPEAYVVASDTFIDKEILINKEIDMLRHASTQSLLTRDDVIIVASVSCIYGLGSPEEYKRFHLHTEIGEKFDRTAFLKKLVSIFYERTNADLEPGKFRVVGPTVEIMSVNLELIYRIEVFGGKIDRITILDPITRTELEEISEFFLFPAKHFVTAPEKLEPALKAIELELKERLKQFAKEDKLIEAQRLERRTRYDLAMIREVGYCNGIENYSRHLSGGNAGEPQDTLISYFPHDKDGNPDFMTFIDESHMTVPQLGGMYNGDQARKTNLVEHGFRLPSAKDNRPLQFHEFQAKVGQTVFVSATPGKYEKAHSENTAQQIIRPTGLLDPQIIIRPVVEDKKTGYRGQVFDFIDEAEQVIAGGGRILATTLTKKMSEDLSDFLKERKLKSVYLHSEIDTIERIEIISDFRRGKYDILVGVNLLREGLDMPEVELIGILDADKEGFLRSETALIQTIGRAARNVKGRVFLYADKITNSMEKAISETDRRRAIQEAYNTKHGITPKTIIKNIKDIRDEIESKHQRTVEISLATEQKEFDKNPEKFLKKKKKAMNAAVAELDFETAAILRDEMYILEKRLIEEEDDKK